LQINAGFKPIVLKERVPNTLQFPLHLNQKGGCPQIPPLSITIQKIFLRFLPFSLILRPNTLHLRLGQLFNAYFPHILFILDKINGPAIVSNVPAFTSESSTLFIAYFFYIKSISVEIFKCGLKQSSFLPPFQFIPVELRSF